MISSETSLVGLLGWPVGHSLSPAMHNAAFAALNLDWAYLPLAVRPDQVSEALAGLIALNFKGCNVTVPHKEAVMRFLDEVDEVGMAIGAVNCIRVVEDRLVGTNTDLHGFLTALKEAGIDPKGSRALVLGAGGGGRAAVYSLSKAGVRSIVVANRHANRAAALVRDLTDQENLTEMSWGTLDRDFLTEQAEKVDLIVNATPVGMHPASAASPWPGEVPLPENAVFVDLVYNPLKTRLMSLAEDAGSRAISGLEMLIHQGALAFEIWTGREAPTAVMRRTCLDQLAEAVNEPPISGG